MDHFWRTFGDYALTLNKPSGEQVAYISLDQNFFFLRGKDREVFPVGATRDEVKAYVLTLWRMNGGEP